MLLCPSNYLLLLATGLTRGATYSFSLGATIRILVEESGLTIADIPYFES